MQNWRGREKKGDRVINEAKAPCSVGIQYRKERKERDEQHQQPYRVPSIVKLAVRVRAENTGADSGQGFGFKELEALLQRVVDRDFAVPANDPHAAVTEDAVSRGTILPREGRRHTIRPPGCHLRQS